MWGRSTKQRKAAVRRKRGERALAFAATRHDLTGLEICANGVDVAALIRYGDWLPDPCAYRLARTSAARLRCWYRVEAGEHATILRAAATDLRGCAKGVRRFWGIA